MIETNFILLSATAILAQILILGWHFKRRSEKQLYAVKVLPVGRSGSGLSGGQTLFVFLPGEQANKANDRERLLYVNTGADEEQWQVIEYR